MRPLEAAFLEARSLQVRHRCRTRDDILPRLSPPADTPLARNAFSFGDAMIRKPARCACEVVHTAWEISIRGISVGTPWITAASPDRSPIERSENLP
jgi:hypothetical protein